MNMKKIILILATLIISFSGISQDAHDLLAKLDNIMFAPEDKQGKVAIILVDKDGEESVR